MRVRRGCDGAGEWGVDSGYLLAARVTSFGLVLHETGECGSSKLHPVLQTSPHHVETLKRHKPPKWPHGSGEGAVAEGMYERREGNQPALTR